MKEKERGRGKRANYYRHTTAPIAASSMTLNESERPDAAEIGEVAGVELESSVLVAGEVELSDEVVGLGAAVVDGVVAEGVVVVVLFTSPPGAAAP